MKITKSLNKFLILTEPIFALDPLMCEQDLTASPVFVLSMTKQSQA